jgi:hypothetical protein
MKNSNAWVVNEGPLASRLDYENWAFSKGIVEKRSVRMGPWLSFSLVVSS